MKKIWQGTCGTLTVIAVLAGVFGTGYYMGQSRVEEAEIVPQEVVEFDAQLPGEVEKRAVTIEEIETKLVEIGELATYSGEYTKATKSADYSRYFLDDIRIPGTTNTVTIECNGVVKVGYDVEDITVSIDSDSMKIYIALPAPEVLDNYVIWDSVKCIAENNILNPIDFEQYQALATEIETEGLKQAEENGIYGAAEDNVKRIIRNYLAVFDEYEVVFM